MAALLPRRHVVPGLPVSTSCSHALLRPGERGQHPSDLHTPPAFGPAAHLLSVARRARRQEPSGLCQAQ